MRAGPADHPAPLHPDLGDDLLPAVEAMAAVNGVVLNVLGQQLQAIPTAGRLARVVGVAKIWSSSLTTVQPMSTGAELPSASRDRAERLTGPRTACPAGLRHPWLQPVFPLGPLLEIESSSALGTRRLLLVIETAGPPVADPQLNLSVGA